MEARTQLVGRLIRVLRLAFSLWVASTHWLGPDPRVPRYVLDQPSEHEPGPPGCGPLC
jgi:hypothetical protein